MGDEHELVPARRGDELRLIEIGMVLGLQHGEGLRTERDRLVEQRGGEIGNADMAREPLPLGLGERRHVLAHGNLRIGPVHQQEVDIVDLERAQAVVDRAGKIVGLKVLVADFGGEENVGARQAGGAQRLADRRLGAVFARGIDVAVAGLKAASTVAAESPPVSGEVPKPMRGIEPVSRGK